MNRMMKKSLLIFISMLFIIQFGLSSETKLPTVHAVSACDEYTEYPGVLPNGFVEYTSKGKFNKKLWYERSIKVYGCVFSFSDANDFEKGSQSDPNNFTTYNPDAGYYMKYGDQGEYRYHGYDAMGNKYINLQFRNDTNSKTKLMDKQWIYQPWEELPSISSKPANAGTVYGSDNPENSVYQKFSQHVSQSLGFAIRNGLILSNPGYVFTGKVDPLGFTLINQAPDTRTPGQATMWHRASSGKIWYQSFNINPLTNLSKNPATVETAANLNEPAPIPKTGKATQKVKVNVTGTLKDELTYSPLNKALINYTRRDIDYWTISIGNEPEQKVYSVKNVGTAKFDLSVPMSMLTADHKYMTVARTTVHYFNGAAAYDESQVVLQFNAVTPDTRFNVNSPIVFTEYADLTPSLLEYQDATAAEFVKYDLKITQGTSQTFTYNTSVMNDAAANADLFSFIKSKFSTGPPPAAPLTKTFSIEQKATNAAGGTSTYSQTVIVTQAMTVPIFIDPEPNIPAEWYDVVTFPASDATTGYTSRSVTIDGVSVNASTFFSGQYTFGAGKHGLHEIVCKWKSPDGSEYLYSMWTVIYDTKPRVQVDLTGIPKQNRKMTATNTSATANDPFVTDVYPMSFTFTFMTMEGDGLSLRTRTNTTMLKEFMYKTPGIYALQITATNSLGRVSDEYITQFEIFKDEPPAIILHPFDVQVARGDKVRLHYDVISTDGDQIASKFLKVWYDADNNGSYEQLLDTYAGSLSEYVTPAGKLGKFKLESYAIESGTQATLAEFLDGTENKFNTQVNYFEVENIQPSSDLYIDYPIAKPFVDVYFMLDAALNTTQANYMLGNKITTTNKLINFNTLPIVDNWNLHTYTYSQDANTSIYSNISYPPNSTYYSSGGYSGTLPLSSVGNSPTSVDNGSYVNTTSSRSFSYTWGPNIITTTNAGVCAPGYTCNANASPASWSINEEGYSGSIPKTGGYNTGTYKCGPGNVYNCTPWYATYEGTLYKTVQTWQSNWVTTNHYTGYYSGTIYQSVRQLYSNTFFRTISDKYLVYMADNTVSQLSDLQNVVNNNSGKLILIGQNAIKAQIAHDHFILNNKTADLLTDEVIQYIIQSNPPIAQVYSLINTPVAALTAETDFDNDPMGSSQMLIYQDANYFDNTQGLMANTTDSYSSSVWKAYSTPFTPTKPGKYSMLRRIKDAPSTDPNFADYAYWSNESQVDIIAHRKPVADVILDYDYDVNQNNYLTTWVDNSYDLDHNITRAATDKGIAGRTLSLYNHTTGVTMYTIPARLYPGSYSLTYVAKDIEGAWSDTITKSFTLSSTPPVQFTAQARTELSQFSMSSVPASENLLAYSLWTRYPYAVSLQFNIGSNTQTVPYYTGKKSGNDISWLNKIINIPNTTADGNYQLRIDAIGSGGGSSFLTFPVTVFTPINLVGMVTDAGGVGLQNGTLGYPELVVNEAYMIKATTSKYPSNVTVNVFKGSGYANNQVLVGTINGTGKNWSRSYTIPAMADGNYTFEWTATTPSGKNQTFTKTVRVINNRPPAADFDWQPKPVWEGDQVSLINQSSDPDLDPLTYAWQITAPNGIVTTATTLNTNQIFHQAGQYIVKLQVSDGTYTTSKSKTITASLLTINSAVNYAPQWLLNHQASHHNTTNIPKDFYSGEVFVVETVTSAAPVQAVKAWIDTIGIDGSVINVEIPLSINGSATSYKGELFDPQFISITRGLPVGLQQIHFQITYSNGVVKQETLPVNIIGNVNQAIGVHRRQ